jgi:hypothetical protein
VRYPLSDRKRRWLLCLEKELRYANPEKHDPKQQAMRINHSFDRLQTCSGASGSIETDPRGTTFLSARAYLFSPTTHALARGFAVFCMPAACYHDLRRA